MTDYRPARLAHILDNAWTALGLPRQFDKTSLSIEVYLPLDDAEFYKTVRNDSTVLLAARVLTRQSYLQLDSAYISAKKVRDFITLHNGEYESIFHLWQAAIETVSGQNIYEVAKLIYPND